MELRVIEQSESVSHIALNGRLDIAGVNQIQMAFTVATAMRHKPVIVDASELEFIASLGMGMLVDAVKTLRRTRAGMVLVAPPALVREALTAARLTDILPIVDTADEARARLGLS